MRILMKRFLTIVAGLAMALTLASCDKENAEKEVVGTWKTNGEDAHFFQVSFDAKGNFDWQVLGASEARETGTYTNSDNTLVLTTKKYYDRWDDATGTEYKDKWIEKKGKPGAGYADDYAGVRTLTIHLLKDGFMYCSLKGDNMFGDMLETTFLFKDSIDQKLTADKLKGTWKAKDASGRELAQYEFNGKNYSRLVKSDNQGNGVIWQDSGTWSYSKGVITFAGGDYDAGFKVFLDGNKLYLSHSINWGFQSSGYIYVKQ